MSKNVLYITGGLSEIIWLPFHFPKVIPWPANKLTLKEKKKQDSKGDIYESAGQGILENIVVAKPFQKKILYAYRKFLDVTKNITPISSSKNHKILPPNPQ